MRRKKFLRALLEHVKPEVELKKNGDYYQLRYDEQTIFAEVLTLDRMQDLLFDLIAAHKSIGFSWENEDVGMDEVWAAEDRVLEEWHKRGDIVRFRDDADEDEVDEEVRSKSSKKR